MKLDTWELISAAIDVGGVFEDGAYRVHNSLGQLHRDDGPAMVYPDGRQCRYRNGQLHRDDGPAIVYPNGAQYWYRNGYAIPAPPGPKAGPARSSSSPNGAQNEDLSSL